MKQFEAIRLPALLAHQYLGAGQKLLGVDALIEAHEKQWLCRHEDRRGGPDRMGVGDPDTTDWIGRGRFSFSQGLIPLWGIVLRRRALDAHVAHIHGHALGWILIRVALHARRATPARNLFA